ncbi:MAG: response regulator [Synechocystis sp.]|nr:response regulator [Synechocystis sp.]
MMSPTATDRPTILVVDDTPDNLTFISGLLKEQYRVKVANNGEKALTIARSDNPPALILLDIMMPDMDGYSVCQTLKADPQTRAIPVIFLTAKAETEDERQGLELGAVDYITKPVSPPILMARVKTQLDLKSSYDSLKDLLGFREDMVNMLVHDLRNPLTNILLLSEIMLANEDIMPEKRRKQLDLIYHNGQKLRLLIDDLLIRGKLESSQMELKRQLINVGDLCQTAIADMRDIGDRKGLRLTLQLPTEPCVRDVDPLLFRRVLDNLIANAIKFAPINSEITMTVDNHDGDRLLIKVADCGPGVKESLRQQIFEKYEVGTLMKGISQTGLGLAFCKIVVEAHGGNIAVTENSPSGSIFTVAV